VILTCGDAGGRTKAGKPCGQARPTLTLCPFHDPASTINMAKVGSEAAIRSRLVPERISLRTPSEQAAVLERAVAGLMTGRQNARAGAAIIEGVKTAARIYENGELERRLAALETAR
jgi:hypothetical protein